MRTAITLLLVSTCLLVVAAVFRPGLMADRRTGNGGALGNTEVYPPSELARLLIRRIRAKSDVARRLIAGDLTLFQAAWLFRELNVYPPVAEGALAPSGPGGEGERLCRQVIGWVDGEMPRTHPRDEATDRVAQLEQELRDHLDIHGEARLEPPPDETADHPNRFRPRASQQ